MDYGNDGGRKNHYFRQAVPESAPGSRQGGIGGGRIRALEQIYSLSQSQMSENSTQPQQPTQMAPFSGNPQQLVSGGQQQSQAGGMQMYQHARGGVNNGSRGGLPPQPQPMLPHGMITQMRPQQPMPGYPHPVSGNAAVLTPWNASQGSSIPRSTTESLAHTNAPLESAHSVGFLQQQQPWPAQALDVRRRSGHGEQGLRQQPPTQSAEDFFASFRPQDSDSLRSTTPTGASVAPGFPGAATEGSKGTDASPGQNQRSANRPVESRDRASDFLTRHETSIEDHANDAGRNPNQYPPLHSRILTPKPTGAAHPHTATMPPENTSQFDTQQFQPVQLRPPQVVSPVVSSRPPLQMREISLELGVEQNAPRTAASRSARSGRLDSGLLPSFSPGNQSACQGIPSQTTISPQQHYPAMASGIPNPGSVSTNTRVPEMAATFTQQPVGAELHGNRPIARFGFGGRLAVISPPLNQVTGTAIQQAGQIRLFELGMILQNCGGDYDTKVLNETIELRGDAKTEAKLKQRLMEAFGRLSTLSHDTKQNDEGFKAIWRVVQTFHSNPEADRFALAAAINGSGPQALLSVGSGTVTSQPSHKSPLRADSSRRESSHDAARKTQELLAAGKQEEALHVATENGLWDLAILISATVNRAAYLSLLEQYAQAALTDGCPLQTLVLSLADKMQDFGGQRVGPHASKEARLHWRETAATLVSCGGGKEPAQKNLFALAQSLASEGRVASSHVCLLAARCRLEADSRNATLVLLGADHRQREGRRVGMGSAASTFASLSFDTAFRSKQEPMVSPFLVPYLFYHAARLVEVGRMEVALKYSDLTFSTIQSYANTSLKSEKVDFAPAFLGEFEEFDGRLRRKIGIKARGSSALQSALSRVFGSSDAIKDGAPLLPSKGQPRGGSDRSTWDSLVASAIGVIAPTEVGEGDRSTLASEKGSSQEGLQATGLQQPQPIPSVPGPQVVPLVNTLNASTTAVRNPLAPAPQHLPGTVPSPQQFMPSPPLMHPSSGGGLPKDAPPRPGSSGSVASLPPSRPPKWDDVRPNTSSSNPDAMGNTATGTKNGTRQQNLLSDAGLKSRGPAKHSVPPTGNFGNSFLPPGAPMDGPLTTFTPTVQDHPAFIGGGSNVPPTQQRRDSEGTGRPDNLSGITSRPSHGSALGPAPVPHEEGKQDSVVPPQMGTAALKIGAVAAQEGLISGKLPEAQKPATAAAPGQHGSIPGKPLGFARPKLPGMSNSQATVAMTSISKPPIAPMRPPGPPPHLASSIPPSLYPGAKPPSIHGIVAPGPQSRSLAPGIPGSSSSSQVVGSLSAAPDVHGGSSAPDVDSVASAQGVHDGSTAQGIYGGSTAQGIYGGATAQGIYDGSSAPGIHGSPPASSNQIGSPAPENQGGSSAPDNQGGSLASGAFLGLGMQTSAPPLKIQGIPAPPPPSTPLTQTSQPPLFSMPSSPGLPETSANDLGKHSGSSAGADAQLLATGVDNGEIRTIIPAPIVAPGMGAVESIFDVSLESKQVDFAIPRPVSSPQLRVNKHDSTGLPSVNLVRDDTGLGPSGESTNVKGTESCEGERSSTAHNKAVHPSEDKKPLNKSQSWMGSVFKSSDKAIDDKVVSAKGPGDNKSAAKAPKSKEDTAGKGGKSPSGKIPGILSKFFKRGGPPKAKLHTGGKFYYDEGKKRWVIEGEEETEESNEVPPPPPMSEHDWTSTAEEESSSEGKVPAAQPGMGTSGSIAQSFQTAKVEQSSPPQATNRFSARSNGRGPKARYVDTFSHKPAQQAAAPTMPAGMTAMNPFVPPPSAGRVTMFVPSAAPTGNEEQDAQTIPDEGENAAQKPDLLKAEVTSVAATAERNETGQHPTPPSDSVGGNQGSLQATTRYEGIVQMRMMPQVSGTVKPPQSTAFSALDTPPLSVQPKSASSPPPDPKTNGQSQQEVTQSASMPTQMIAPPMSSQLAALSAPISFTGSSQLDATPFSPVGGSEHNSKASTSGECAQVKNSGKQPGDLAARVASAPVVPKWTPPPGLGPRTNLPQKVQSAAFVASSRPALFMKPPIMIGKNAMKSSEQARHGTDATTLDSLPVLPQSQNVEAELQEQEQFGTDTHPQKNDGPGLTQQEAEARLQQPQIVMPSLRQQEAAEGSVQLQEHAGGTLQTQHDNAETVSVRQKLGPPPMQEESAGSGPQQLKDVGFGLEQAEVVASEEARGEEKDPHLLPPRSFEAGLQQQGNYARGLQEEPTNLSEIQQQLNTESRQQEPEKSEPGLEQEENIERESEQQGLAARGRRQQESGQQWRHQPFVPSIDSTHTLMEQDRGGPTPKPEESLELARQKLEEVVHTQQQQVSSPQPLPSLAPGLKPPPSLATGLKPPQSLAPGLKPPPSLAPGLKPPPSLAPGLKPPPSLVPGVKPPPSLVPGVKPPPSLVPGVKPPPSLVPGFKPPPSLAPGLKPPPSLATGVQPLQSLASGVRPPQSLAAGVQQPSIFAAGVPINAPELQQSPIDASGLQQSPTTAHGLHQSPTSAPGLLQPQSLASGLQPFTSMTPEQWQTESLAPEQLQPESLILEQRQPESLTPEQRQPERLTPEQQRPVSLAQQRPVSLAPEQKQPGSLAPKQQRLGSPAPEQQQSGSLAFKPQQPQSFATDLQQPQSLATDLQLPQSLTPDLRQPQSLTPDLQQPHSLAPDLQEPQGLAPGLQQPPGPAPGLQQPPGPAPELLQPQGLAPRLQQPQGLAPRLQQPQDLAPRLQQPQGLTPGMQQLQTFAPEVQQPEGLSPGHSQSFATEVQQPEGLSPGHSQSFATELQQQSPSLGVQQPQNHSLGLQQLQNPSLGLQQQGLGFGPQQQEETVPGLEGGPGLLQPESSRLGPQLQETFASGNQHQDFSPIGVQQTERYSSGVQHSERPLSHMQQQERPPSGVQPQETPPNGMHQQERLTSGVQQQERPPSGVQQQERPPSGVQQQEWSPIGMQHQKRPSSGVEIQERPSNGVQQQERPPSTVQQQERSTHGVHTQQDVPFASQQQKRSSFELPKQERPPDELPKQERPPLGLPKQERPSFESPNLEKQPFEPTNLANTLQERQPQDAAPLELQQLGSLGGGMQFQESFKPSQWEKLRPELQQQERLGLGQKEHQSVDPEALEQMAESQGQRNTAEKHIPSTGANAFALMEVIPMEGSTGKSSGQLSSKPLAPLDFFRRLPGCKRKDSAVPASRCMPREALAPTLSGAVVNPSRSGSVAKSSLDYRTTSDRFGNSRGQRSPQPLISCQPGVNMSQDGTATGRTKPQTVSEHDPAIFSEERNGAQQASASSSFAETDFYGQGNQEQPAKTSGLEKASSPHVSAGALYGWQRAPDAWKPRSADASNATTNPNDDFPQGAPGFDEMPGREQTSPESAISTGWQRRSFVDESLMATVSPGGSQQPLAMSASSPGPQSRSQQSEESWTPQEVQDTFDEPVTRKSGTKSIGRVQNDDSKPHSRPKSFASRRRGLGARRIDDRRVDEKSDGQHQPVGTHGGINLAATLNPELQALPEIPSDLSASRGDRSKFLSIDPEESGGERSSMSAPIGVPRNTGGNSIESVSEGKRVEPPGFSGGKSPYTHFLEQRDAIRFGDLPPDPRRKSRPKNWSEQSSQHQEQQNQPSESIEHEPRSFEQRKSQGVSASTSARLSQRTGRQSTSWKQRGFDN